MNARPTVVQFRIDGADEMQKRVDDVVRAHRAYAAAVKRLSRHRMKLRAVSTREEGRA